MGRAIEQLVVAELEPRLAADILDVNEDERASRSCRGEARREPGPARR